MSRTVRTGAQSPTQYQTEMRKSLGLSLHGAGNRKTLGSQFAALPLAHGCLRAAEAAIQCGHLAFAAHWIDEAMLHAKQARMALGDVQAAASADFASMGFKSSMGDSLDRLDGGPR